jgi:uncharacterized protein YPO0396
MRPRLTPSSSETPPDDTIFYSLEPLGSRLQDLIEVINRLERNGIATTLPLPKIVVIGDQSAGKSSLIEAISEITVPRVKISIPRYYHNTNMFDRILAHVHGACYNSV